MTHKMSSVECYSDGIQLNHVVYDGGGGTISGSQEGGGSFSIMKSMLYLNGTFLMSVTTSRAPKDNYNPLHIVLVKKTKFKKTDSIVHLLLTLTL